MLIAMMQGGLGNQLFIYYMLKKLSLSVGVEYAFDISSYNSDKYGRSLELEELGPRVEKVEKIIFKYRAIRKTLHLVGGLFSFSSGSQYIHIEKKYNEYQKISVGNFKTVYLIGYFQHQDYIDRDMVLDEIKNTRFYKDIFELISNKYDRESSIAIHIRSYAEVESPSVEHITGEYIAGSLRALGYQAGRHQLVVFTDNEKLAKCLMNGLDFEFYPNESSARTMAAMSCFNKIVCSNSSFSWWAAYISGASHIAYPRYTGYLHYPTPCTNWLVV